MLRAEGSLRDRVAVITGASSGIGLAATALFARAGATVVPVANDPVSEVGDRLPGDAAGRYVEVDVTSPGDVERLFEQVAAQHARLDVVYSNAGVMGAGTAAETSHPEWDRVIGVNLTGHFNVAKHALPLLGDAPAGGSLIFTASDLGLVGARATVAYCAAKGGLVNMARALAVDAAPRVRVNCVAPGPVDTPMLRGWFAGASDPEALRAAQLRSVPMARLADPEEVAQAALFLASTASSFVTGTTLSVDGGVTSWYGL